MQQISNFINGELYSARNFFSKKNPYTGEDLYSVYDSNIVDVVASIQGAQKAYAEWKSSTLTERLDLLQKIKSAYEKKQKRIIQLESLDQGLPANFTAKANYEFGLKLFDRYKTELENLKADLNVQPVGVVAVVLSWNLSNRLFIERVIPAVLAGNAVVVKLSGLAPATNIIWSEIFQEIELPKGLIQLINAATDGVKNLLVTHPGVKALSVVGSLQTTSEILKKTSELSHNQFKKMQLSSGTKNPAVALAEPTEKMAHEIFDSFMIGQGQLAWNSARLFILEKHESQWKELLTNYMQTLKPSQGIEDSSVWTPILRDSSFHTFQELEALAKQDHAKLIRSSLVLSELLKDKFLVPTFTQDMSNCSTLQQDEVASPLYILSAVKYPFDVPKYSNVSYYGHSASIWGEPEKLQKVVQSLDVGLVSLNQWSVFVTEPLQSVKQSAFGIQDYRIFGDFFSNVKTVTISK